MKTLQITPIAKVRVWNNERATSGFVAHGVLERSAHPSDIESSNALIVGIEALVPRGAMAEYGLIGLQFIPDNLNRLQCEVLYSAGMSSNAWPDSLASKLDQVHLGLPKEYAPAVLSALSLAVEGRLASGVVRIIDAAHGQVGSSPNFFGKLTKAAVELALLVRVDLPDDQAVKLLRGILVG